MLKQRLVGFIVLFALTVIFWPIVFMSPEPEREVTLPAFEMPPMPQLTMSEKKPANAADMNTARLPIIASIPEQAEQPVDIARANTSMELIAADSQPDGQISAIQRAEFDAQGLPLSWELQVGTFSKEGRAEEVADELRQKGHKAYVSPVKIGGEQLYRVRIGPKIQRQRLIDIKPSIDAYYGVESQLIRFEV